MEEVEAWVSATCSRANLPEVLLTLRMLCEPGYTVMFYCEEHVLVEGEGLVARGQTTRGRPPYVWRLRNEASAPMVEDGDYDHARRELDEPLHKLATRPKTRSVIVERAVGRRVQAAKGRRLRLRHRITSAYAFANGTDFFDRCGLRAEAAGRTVFGRRYAHFMGVVAQVSTDSQRPKDAEVSVEFFALVPESKEERNVATRVERLVESVAKWLVFT